MRSSSLLVLLTATPALSSLLAPIELLRREFGPLLPRQDQQTSFDLSFTGKQGNTATTEPTSSGTQGSASATGSGQSGSATGTQSGDNKDNNSSGSKTSQATTKTFDQRLPAGGVQMITPAPTAQASYYKIADQVTFAWNYTSLSITPSAVDVLASCSLNQQIYTISANMSITNATQSVTWDTGEYQKTATIPLLTETYTLIIHDAAQDVSATAKAGYLGTYNQFTFGMYVPQPYTPIAEWTCATCNAAMSSMERQTLGFVFMMAFVTVMSFTWFGNVAGLL